MELDGGRSPAPVRPGRAIEVDPLEVYERRGDGHTLARHCGTSPAEEALRLRRHPFLPATGAFPDAITAQRAVQACVDANRTAVALWRRGSRARLAIAHDGGVVIGDVLQRRRLEAGDARPQPATAVRVVLRRNPAYPAGFAVLTAYPVLGTARSYPPLR